MTLSVFDDKLRKFHFFGILHILILIVSIYLVIIISIDTFKNLAFYKEPRFLYIQTWICLFFLADFFIEFFLSPTKGRYLAQRWAFLLVSIPWLAIFHHFGWHFTKEVEYLIQFIPLVRGGYAMAFVVGWFTSNRATSLFWSYLITLLATIYFSSLAFYLFEHHINPEVKDYYSALWWAFMDVTTVGSNIEAITPVGRVLSVLLAALGMMMFPIFTVYVSDNIKNKSRKNTKSDQSPKTVSTDKMASATADGSTGS